MLDIVYSILGKRIDFDTCHGVENGCQGDLGGESAHKGDLATRNVNLEACVVDDALR